MIMRLKHVKGSEEAVSKSSFVLHTPEEVKEKLNEMPGRQLFLEIGMGKGRFITENALLNPDVFYIGIEMYESVMIKAIKRLEDMEDSFPLNLMFLRMDAKDIRDFFPDESVDRIYLNFSDPWPKNRHSKRRLPSREFLTIFRSILKAGGDIEFKTDNRDLFDFALKEFEPAGFKLEYKTFDLHSDRAEMEDNVMTEYEEKFSSLGNPICKYRIRKL